MCGDAGGQSLHYFHSYAVRNRLNLHRCSDILPSIPVEWTMETYKEYHCHLQDDFVHIMTRVIVDRIPFFQQFNGLILKHIPKKWVRNQKW